MSKPISLTRFLIQEQHAGHINADLRLLIEVVARACKSISTAVGKGALGGVLGDAGTGNIQGEAQKKLDVLSNEILLEAIVRVAAGETLLAPVPTDPVRARYAYRDRSEPSERFSEREVAILRLLAGGYSNREIAKAVFLSEGTVKNYVSDILDKLGTRDRTRAVLKAITLRVI